MGKYLVSYDGTRIYYNHHKGRNPLTLVFLHGVGANWTVWRKEVNYFKRRGYSTLAMDFRGHGRSDMPPEFEKYRPPLFARDLYEILQFENVNNFVLLGHSLGGAIAVNYCMLYKRNYPRSLVLVESTITYPFDHNRLFNLSPYVTHFLRFIASHQLTRQQQFTHFDDIDLSHPGIEERLHLISHMLHLTPLRCIVRTLDNVERYVFKNKGKIYTTLQHLRLPTLLLAGELDHIIPPRFSRKIKSIDHRAVLKIIEGAHHRVIINDPGKVCHIIDTFLHDNQKN